MMLVPQAQAMAMLEAMAVAQVLAVLESEAQVMATIEATTGAVLEPLGSIQRFTELLDSESWRPARELDPLSRLRQ